MKHVWLVSDNVDGFNTKVFSSRYRAAEYFKKVLKDNEVSLREITESKKDMKKYSALYNGKFWIHLRKAVVNL